MPQMTPPQGGQPQPQGAPATQGAPQQGAPAPQQQGPKASDLLQGISKGMEMLGGMLKQAGPQLPPDDHKNFQAAQSTWMAFAQGIQAEMGGQSQGAPQPGQGPAKPSQPMPAHANPGAKPAPQY